MGWFNAPTRNKPNQHLPNKLLSAAAVRKIMATRRTRRFARGGDDCLCITATVRLERSGLEAPEYVPPANSDAYTARARIRLLSLSTDRDP
jgi:hypothetical protein